jgi:hypothetical protein
MSEVENEAASREQASQPFDLQRTKKKRCHAKAQAPFSEIGE